MTAEEVLEQEPLVLLKCIEASLQKLIKIRESCIVVTLLLTESQTVFFLKVKLIKIKDITRSASE